MLADLFSASPFSRRGACRLSVALLTAALVAFVGCDPPKPSRPSGASRTGATSGTGGATAAGKVVIPDGVSSSSPAGPATETARELLGRLAATYRAASTYSDEGRLVMWSVSGTKSSSDVIAPFVCQYARPNKFRLTCYDAEASCDGREFLARIGAYPDQMLRKDAPAAITPDELLGDPMFAQSMAGRLGVLNPLIGLLFDPEAAKALVFEAGEPKFDSPGVFETHNCWRVRQPTGAGDLVYWIDQQDTILRRIELPTDDVKPQLDPGYRLAQLALTVDFNKAAFGAKIPPDRFTLGISQDVALVNRFLDLQPPDAPSPWLGKPVPDVRIKASNGQETTLAAFRGKTLVIEVWATWCPWCVQSLPLVDKAFSKFRENSSVQFLALSVDDPAIKDEALTAALQGLKVTLPWAREIDKSFSKAANDARLPVLLVVDAEGIVQIHEIGFNEDLIAKLQALVDSLRAGKRVWQQTVAAYDAAKKSYDQALLAGAVHDEPTDPAPLTVPAAPRKEPETLSLRPLFTVPQIQPRGTILPLPAEGGKPERLAVVDGWRTVIEIAPDGQPIGRFDLGLPTQSVATLLRTATTPDGKRIFAAGAPGQSQAFVFDGDWRPMFTYPNDGSTLGTADLLLTDAEKPGEIELVVGCYGEAGVHGVDLAGKRKWVAEKWEDSAHLAIGPRSETSRTLLTTNKRGTLIAFDPPTDAPRETFVGRTAARPLGVFLRTLRGADSNVSQTDPQAFVYAGLAKPSLEQELLIGLRVDGAEMWRVGVPSGAPTEPVEQITSGPLPNATGDVWAVATADGQILFISAEGRVVDRFAVGKPLAGVRLTKLAGKFVLLVSSVDVEKRPLLEAFELRAK